MTVTVDFDLGKVNAVTTADAARELGISTARVTQMCEKGILTSWKDGSKRLSLCDSLDARLAENLK